MRLWYFTHPNGQDYGVRADDSIRAERAAYDMVLRETGSIAAAEIAAGSVHDGTDPEAEIKAGTQ